MKFGPVTPEEGVGGVTVHAIRQNGLVLKKGTMIGPDEVARLKEVGVEEIVVARSSGRRSPRGEPASIARRWAEGVIVEGAITGARSNLFAEEAG